MRAKKILTGILVVIVCLTTSRAHAVYWPQITFEDLCKKSTIIVDATVVSVRCFYSEEKDPKICTSITFKVNESFKGDKKEMQTFEIIRYGGTIGEISYIQLYAPSYTVGDNVLLFLDEFISETFGRNYGVLGLSEGKFTITNGMVYRDYPIPLKFSNENKEIIATKSNPIIKTEFVNKIKLSIY